MNRFNLLWENLKRLGHKKLSALALVFVLVIGTVGVGAYLLSRPNFESLYAGLERDDVSRIGAVLKSSGIAFDINPEGNTILVHVGQSAQARMLLAEHGLPQSSNAGYELFDKVGALGLTSFMQEVTRVRATEGELARTIQLIRGVKAARVHVVMPDEGSFRRAKQPPSASVVIRTESPDDSAAAQAIRRLIAAAIPGMTVDQVTVLNTDGTILLASDGDPTDAIPGKTLSLEKGLSKDIQDNIRRTLTPYLRLPNFQVSVRARINTDRRQTNETIYDPDSKVERTTRTVKENSTSQNGAAAVPTSVERNIPQDKPSVADGKQSNDENKKSEEQTNYDVSTKTVTTVSGGYSIENLSIAVLINRSAFGEAKGAPKPETVERQLKEIEEIVASAAGINKQRGDILKVSAVDFTFDEHEMAPMQSPGWLEAFNQHFGTITNAATLLVITAVIVIFGLNPATRALLAPPGAEIPEIQKLLASEAGFEVTAQTTPPQIPLSRQAESSEQIVISERGSVRQKLEDIVAADELLAASALKRWMRSDETQ